MIKRIILASCSKQRRELLAMLGIPHEAMDAGVDEDVDPAGITPAEYAEGLALRKCRAVGERFGSDGETLVIAGDTIVFHRGRILGKPSSAEDAVATLTSLSGDWHEAYTGYALMMGRKLIGGCTSTRVRFRELSPEEITGYVATGDPLNKAGSYGIQSAGAVFVDRIEGDYFTVVGLPICALTENMRREFGYDLYAK